RRLLGSLKSLQQWTAEAKAAVLRSSQYSRQRCTGLDTACFPGCTSIESWGPCAAYNVPQNQTFNSTCYTCIPEQQQQQQHANSSEPTSPCLPDRAHVGVRGFTSGILSKLRPPENNLITELSLRECGITYLEQDTFSAFLELSHLYLDHNNLTHVKWNWFSGLMFPKSLRTLSLAHNHINNIDPKCFQNITILEGLLLNSNYLQNIRPFWFHGLRNLVRLSLKSNSIKSIHPQAFESLSRLRELDLSRNAFTCLSSDSMKALQMLRLLEVSGNRLPPLDDPVSPVTKWRLHYRLASSKKGPDVSVRVNEELFCITESYLNKNLVHIHMNTLDKLPPAEIDVLSPYNSCSRRRRDIAGAAVGMYKVPFVMISVNSDADKPPNATQWCRHAWGDAGSVRVAVGLGVTLRIVPLAAGGSDEPQVVAVVLSADMEGVDRIYMNVSCFLKARGEMYLHVFPVIASDTSSGVMCEEKRTETEITEEPQTRPNKTQTTEEPQTPPNTKVSLDQTSPYTTPAVTSTVEREKERPLPDGVGIFTGLTVVGGVQLAGVVLIALLIGACIMRKRYGSRDHQAAQAPPGPPLAVVPTSRWIISGANSRTVGVSQCTPCPGTGAGTAGQDSQSSTSDELEYSRIPDEHFTYYNTRPWVQHPYWEIPDHNDSNLNARPEAQHSYWKITDDGDYYNAQPLGVQHPYCEISDSYFDYENTRPHSLPPHTVHTMMMMMCVSTPPKLRWSFLQQPDRAAGIQPTAQPLQRQKPRIGTEQHVRGRHA
ncbi:PREDICTED: uncharacterized protein LOC109469102, partial [Branchiostoma belcheri]|uniref:Uncharacterized protein LOC109469102 n=1 Tax=Branchiostoma belcheri TaxID=7741 RepID=A0A6P4YMZ8_BRABE